MPSYPVKNLKTGEEKEIKMTMTEYTEWRKENPDWDRDWVKGVGGSCEEGEWKSRLANKHPGWKHVLDKVKRTPGSRARDLY